MPKHKLQRFADIKTYYNVLEPTYKEIINDYKYKGKWNSLFFKNNNPLCLELGCGKGEYTVWLASNRQHINHLGIDIKGARIWRGAKNLIEQNISNAAFLRIQINLIEHCFAPGEISEIWITFPDPFPKIKFAKKRLTSNVFLNKYKKILTADNLIHLKTDNYQLYIYTKEIIKSLNHILLEDISDIYNNPVPGPHTAVRTFYEAQFLNQSKAIYYLKFRLT